MTEETGGGYSLPDDYVKGEGPDFTCGDDYYKRFSSAEEVWTTKNFWICTKNENDEWDEDPVINPFYHNKVLVVAYMTLMGVQIIVLWVRLTGILQRTAFMGPLLGMMANLLKEVLTFFVVIILLLIGFMFALYYVAGGDLDRDVPDVYKIMYADIETNVGALGDYQEEIQPEDELANALSSIRGVATYLFHTLLGQQDWEVINENNEYHVYGYNFGRGRSAVMQLVMIIFVCIGTLTLLNILIAIMTTSFDEQRSNSQKELAFLRVESTYELAHRGRVMPAPFNIFAFGFAAVIQLLNYIIQLITCNRLKLNLDDLNPLYVKCLSRTGTSSLMEHRPDKHSSRATNTEDIKKTLTMFDENNKIKKDNKKNKAKDIAMKTKESVKNIGFTMRNIELGNIFDTIDELSTQDTKLYCKHCYFKMRRVRGGKIDNYFKLFDSKQGYNIDSHDIQLIKKYFRRCSLCPQCFRPYKLTFKQVKKEDKPSLCRKLFCCYICRSSKRKQMSQNEPDDTDNNNDQEMDIESENSDDLDPDRYSRWHVILEIVSCWLFIIFISWILMIILLIPALFKRCFIKLDKQEKAERLKLQQNVGAGTFGDYHQGGYHYRVKRIVEANGDPDEVFAAEDETFKGKKPQSSEEVIQSKLDDLMHEIETMKLQNQIHAANLQKQPSKKPSPKKPAKNRSKLYHHKGSMNLIVNLNNKSDTDSQVST